MRHYVYCLMSSLDLSIFYVGKGQGDRINVHERQARAGTDDYKSRKIRSIWFEGGKVIKTKLFETDSNEEALALEVKLIKEIGRANLCNMTDGGDGVTNPSEEFRLKISRIHKGKTLSEEHKAAISKASKGNQTRKGQPVSQETRRKRSNSLKGREITTEHRMKLREAGMGRQMSDEWRQKLKDAWVRRKARAKELACTSATGCDL